MKRDIAIIARRGFVYGGRRYRRGDVLLVSCAAAEHFVSNRQAELKEQEQKCQSITADSSYCSAQRVAISRRCLSAINTAGAAIIASPPFLRVAIVVIWNTIKIVRDHSSRKGKMSHVTA